MEDIVLPWLHKILAVTVNSEQLSQSLFQQWKNRLNFYATETFCALRIEELFDIIVEFPESEPALNDLRSCVDTTGQQMNLIQSLRNLIFSRLLHVGANTSDIITQYI